MPDISTRPDRASQLADMAQLEGSMAAIKMARSGAYLELSGDASGAGAAFTLGRMLAIEYGLGEPDYLQAVREARSEAQTTVATWDRLAAIFPAKEAQARIERDKHCKRQGTESM